MLSSVQGLNILPKYVGQTSCAKYVEKGIKRLRVSKENLQQSLQWLFQVKVKIKKTNPPPANSRKIDLSVPLQNTAAVAEG